MRVRLLLFFGLIFIISIFLKLMMPSQAPSSLVDNKKYKINAYSQVDSILEFSNYYVNFGNINNQNWGQQLKSFNGSEFHSHSLEYYAYGNLYYSLWKESLAARNMLLEIQNSLFLKPPIDRFSPQIPINHDSLLIDYGLGKSDLDFLEKMYNEYKDRFHLYDTGLLDKNSKNIFHKETLANPKYFNFLANNYYNEALTNLTLFVHAEDSLFSGGLKSRARLALLCAVQKDKNKIKLILPNRVLSALLDSLYQDNYALKIETIELIAYLEKIDYINQDKVLEIHNNLKLEIAKALLQNKREILGMGGIHDFSIIDSTALFKEKEEAIIYYPEYIITTSEKFFLNNEIRKAEEIINELWFKDSEPKPPPHSEWFFENYPEYLLKTIRLGYWDGARLPHYLGNVHDLYSQEKNYDGLRDTLELFVSMVTEFVGSNKIFN